VLILYGWFFGVQTVCLIGLRFVDRTVVDAVPQPLDLNSVSPPVTLLKASNCSFYVPWTNCVGTDLSAGAISWTCEGSGIYITYVNDREFLESLADNEDGIKLDELRSVMGFAFRSNVLFTTSADVSLFDPRDDAKMKSYMLLCKMLASSGPLSGVYSLECQGLKGFQEGALSENSMVSLSVFAQEDWEHTLIVAVPSESEIAPSQQDINTIITTFSVEP